MKLNFAAYKEYEILLEEKILRPVGIRKLNSYYDNTVVKMKDDFEKSDLFLALNDDMSTYRAREAKMGEIASHIRVVGLGDEYDRCEEVVGDRKRTNEGEPSRNPFGQVKALQKQGFAILI